MAVFLIHPIHSEPVPPIAGGVMFRTDDNGDAAYWQARMEVFQKHGATFGAALNFVSAESDPKLVETIRAMQAAGHDLTDHTPTHDNIKIDFRNPADAEEAAKHPGVDHMKGQTAFLKVNFTPPPADRPKAKVKITGGKLHLPDGTEDRRLLANADFLYFPALEKLVWINTRESKTGPFTLENVWRQKDVDMGEHDSIEVQRVEGFEILPTSEAIDLSVNSVRRVCERIGIRAPVTYIAPGNPTRLTRELVKATYGERHGYLSAAVYPKAAARVFHEPDPDSTAPYAMQWGDLSDEKMTLSEIQSRIADLLAVNKVVIIGSHIYGKQEGRTAYFAKIDDLLAWLKSKGIPIRSHAEWAKILYRDKTRLSGPVFPRLDRDLDENGRPDGFELQNARMVDAPLESGMKTPLALYLTEPGLVFRVRGLGGLPHGPAIFQMHVKGPPDSSLRLQIEGMPLQVVSLNGQWQTQQVPLQIPSDLATIRVDVAWIAPNGGEFFAGDFSLEPATP